MTQPRLVELTLAALLALLLALDLAFPPPIPRDAPGAVVLARDGTPLRTWPDADGIWRQPVTPEQVSPLYLDALLGYEDRWFHWHPGVNPVALARAAGQWLRHGRIVSGGSTLTMQVARLIDPPPPGTSRSLRAKARQIARALQLELRLSKREILTLYLNRAPMGGIVEGVEMASRGYLGRPALHLSHAEAALLAALPQAPSRLRPDRDPAAARTARDKVLQRLLAQGVWDARTVADARLEQVAAQPLRAQWLAPLAAERVRAQARGAARGAPAPLLRSTLSAELQAGVERLLLDRVEALPPRVSMAVLVMDNDTLDVLAYAGSADFADPKRAAHVDMTRAVRSPGSTLKPFLYALALDEGLIHSESLLVDAPQSFGGYQPGNFQASFSGPVSVAEALQKSLNVPAVDLLDRLTPQRFAAVLRAGGLGLRLPGAEPNLSLILGGAGTTLEELVGAYRALARGGLSGRPRLTPEAPRVEGRLMSAGAAFIVRDILEGGGHPERPFTEGLRRLAWKTGTSFGFRDAWAVGVTEQHTLGVWVGRPDGTPNPGFFGANTAAPLLQDLVALLPEAEAAPAARVPPPGVAPLHSCWPLGLSVQATAPAHCLVRRTGWMLDGAAPPTLPDRERSGGLLGAGCGTEGQSVARWPTALAPWVGAAAPGCADSGSALRISGLDEGSLLKPVPGQAEVEIRVWAQGDVAPGERLYWLLEGVQQRRGPAGEAVTLRLPPGRHTLTLLDERGRWQRVAFRVAAP
ncbi:penicillin-binding protein 1C [Azohydromonas caseinilytica]|uniref:peptidoglycan glycosyltransferase n=1 Tax=Azohydromonas caseinilytica TaxID=2728836 RepID=A0A848FE07_9BURK|nr:penicillin-binding protein 1C [Azohydromonas caseinilytica]NML17674.1 penicillin-binding protein 1C [Azohydromonas caseinilytica]